MRKTITASCLTAAILLTSSWIVLSPAQTNPVVPPAARKELLAAAKAHGVSIKVDKIVYVNNQTMTIVRAPIIGIDKYSDDDFAKGAPIQLMVIKSKTKLAVPDGSYVVKVQYQRNVASGKAIFTDAAGTVVAQRDFDRPILTLPDLPDRDDHGESGIDSCSIYLEIFPRLDPVGSLSVPMLEAKCAKCACAHYNWGRSHESGITAEAREINAWFRGRDAANECMRTTASICPPLPPRLP